ncbi:unnamed protein product [Protopolystoma xenopodis]|uniref:Uncharacterized protein n=1 Tax=Protopolystoma xenopodis TaxID=117903 RepID=A0A448WH37_9PLAT|nr:unnamed protein product [Protopolystoma xenopodis]
MLSGCRHVTLHPLLLASSHRHFTVPISKWTMRGVNHTVAVGHGDKLVFIRRLLYLPSASHYNNAPGLCLLSVPSPIRGLGPSCLNYTEIQPSPSSMFYLPLAASH